MFGGEPVAGAVRQAHVVLHRSACTSHRTFIRTSLVSRVTDSTWLRADRRTSPHRGICGCPTSICKSAGHSLGSRTSLDLASQLGRRSWACGACAWCAAFAGFGHRWPWRLTEDGWPYHERTRCGSGGSWADRSLPETSSRRRASLSAVNGMTAHQADPGGSRKRNGCRNIHGCC